MNHRKFGKKLGRNRRERDALFRSQIRSMFTYGAIRTTDAKVKAIVPLVEKLSHSIVTKSSLLASRELEKYIQDRHLVSRICQEFKEVFANQTSNFTRYWNSAIRQGDNALIVMFSFVKPYSLKTEVVKATTPKTAPVKSEAKKTPKKTVTKKTK